MRLTGAVFGRPAAAAVSRSMTASEGGDDGVVRSVLGGAPALGLDAADCATSRSAAQATRSLSDDRCRLMAPYRRLRRAPAYRGRCPLRRAAESARRETSISRSPPP